LRTYSTDPEFWPTAAEDKQLNSFLGVLRSNTPENIGNHMLQQLRANKVKIEADRKKQKENSLSKKELEAEAEAIRQEDLASEGAK
jgi:hypothetical protein